MLARAANTCIIGVGTRGAVSILTEGGYVLSKEALRRFAMKGFKNSEICGEHGGAEDVEFGACKYVYWVSGAERRVHSY